MKNNIQNDKKIQYDIFLIISFAKKKAIFIYYEKERNSKTDTHMTDILKNSLKIWDITFIINLKVRIICFWPVIQTIHEIYIKEINYKIFYVS